MRRILCEQCGKFSGLNPPEDAARGLFPRRLHGRSRTIMACALCGATIYPDSKVVAESIPRDMSYWEKDYLQ